MLRTKIIMVAILIVLLLSTQFVFAAWSPRGTFYLTGDEAYKFTTVDGKQLYALKATNSKYFYVDTYWRTMTTSPAFMLRNSNNQMRSNEVNCAVAGGRANGTGNQGSIGYNYYASMRAGWLQYGDDTINIDFTPD